MLVMLDSSNVGILSQFEFLDEKGLRLSNRFKSSRLTLKEHVKEREGWKCPCRDASCPIALAMCHVVAPRDPWSL